jgi:hypothetical protein
LLEYPNHHQTSGIVFERWNVMLLRKAMYSHGLKSQLLCCCNTPRVAMVMSFLLGIGRLVVVGIPSSYCVSAAHTTQNQRKCLESHRKGAA